MDLYTLKAGFEKDEIIDEFDSLVWTERYNDSGEMQLTLPATSKFAKLLVEGVYLHTPASAELMIVETNSVDTGLLTVVGKTMTEFLKSRILRDTGSTVKTYWPFTAMSSSEIARSIVTNMCMPGGLMSGTNLVLPGTNGLLELIPGLTAAAAIPGDDQNLPVPYGNVFDGVKLACDLDGLGFRMRPTNFTDGLGGKIFETYRGADRTSTQTVNPPVIFEPALDTLTNVKKVRSLAGYVNVVWAWPQGGTSVTQIGVAYASTAGIAGDFQRRTMMLDASDVNVSDYATTPLLIAALNAKATEALWNNNYVRMVDGQLVPQDAFQYGRDYFLGDIIELRDSDGTVQQTRITEYIRAQDSTGERAYPTLSVSSS